MNMTQQMMQLLSNKINISQIPTRVVYSALNTIVTNRNLASMESVGQYRILIDDDVKLVGPVVSRLVQALIEHPEIGVVGIPSYDYGLSTFKPRWHNLKQHVFGEDLMIVNAVGGMVMATRQELVTTWPFITFWPNNGEDVQLAQQVHRFGFLSAYVYPDDVYGIHEDVNFRATASTQTGVNSLVSEILTYYLQPAYYHSMRHHLAVRWLSRHSNQIYPISQVEHFWDYLKVKTTEFINGEIGLQDIDFNINDWSVNMKQAITMALEEIAPRRESIRAFKANYYNLTDYAGTDPFLGPMQFNLALKEIGAMPIKVTATNEAKVAMKVAIVADFEAKRIEVGSHTRLENQNHYQLAKVGKISEIITMMDEVVKAGFIATVDRIDVLKGLRVNNKTATIGFFCEQYCCSPSCG